MFNLIISIIAIALIVALAGAAMFYGGNTYTDSKSEALIAAYKNQILQLEAAVILKDSIEGSNFLSPKATYYWLDDQTGSANHLDLSNYIKKPFKTPIGEDATGRAAYYWINSDENDTERFIIATNILSNKIGEIKPVSTHNIYTVTKEFCDMINQKEDDFFCYQGLTDNSAAKALRDKNTNINPDAFSNPVVYIGKKVK